MQSGTEFRPKASTTDFSFMGIDPVALLSLFRRRLRLFLTTMLLLMVVIVGYTLQLQPRYTAAADVLIDSSRSLIDLQSVMSGLPSDNNTVDTQVQIIKSQSLAERVVRKLNLQNDPEFNPTLTPQVGLIDRILGSDKPPARRPDPNSQAIIDYTVQRVLGGLAVQRAGLTYIMSVRYTAASPAKAAALANAFAEEYIVDQLEAKAQATRTVNNWLGDRLGQLRQEVETADIRVQQYKIANGLLSAQGATMAEQEVSTLNQQIATARADLSEKKALLQTAREQVRIGGGGADVGAALGSGTISSLRSQEADASRNLADLNARYGPRHPEVVKAQGQLEAIRSQIQQEIDRILSNLDSQVSVATQRLDSLLASQGTARGTLSSNSRAQVGLLELERRAEASRAIYEELLNRSKETSAEAGIQQPDARVLSVARRGWQSFPNLSLAILMGFAVGLIAGACAVAVAELFETGFANGEAIESRLGLNYLGGLPLAPKQRGKRKDSPPEDYLTQFPLSAFAEAFRNLRASILLSKSADGEAPRVVAVCSALPSEGKTVSSIGLMRTIALSGSKVVLIDADLRRRGVSRVFTPATDSGLVEVLEGTVNLKDALMIDPLSGGSVLPVVATPESGEDLLGSAKMDQLLEKLRGQFDMIVIDTPPVLALAEARLISAKVDGVVFVVRWRRTPSRAAQIALTSLRDSGANVLGVALSQVDLERQRSFGYGDGTYYFSKYRDYYAS